MLPVEIVLAVLAAAVLLTAFWCGMRTFRAKQDAEAELAQLGGRLLDVQESERSRIASELHDGISQELAVVALNLDDMEVRLTGSSGQRAEIMLLARRVRRIADEIQHITRGLHPARLQHLGLVPSLRALAAEMQHGQVCIEVAEHGWPTDLPADVALSLYRVAQEAIHNAIKHSGSGSILVSRSSWTKGSGCNNRIRSSNAATCSCAIGTATGPISSAWRWTTPARACTW